MPKHDKKNKTEKKKTNKKEKSVVVIDRKLFNKVLSYSDCVVNILENDK